jgi:hypothetical protein
VSISMGVTRIAARAFFSCKALNLVVIPDGILEIEDEVLKTRLGGGKGAGQSHVLRTLPPHHHVPPSPLPPPPSPPPGILFPMPAKHTPS